MGKSEIGYMGYWEKDNFLDVFAASTCRNSAFGEIV